MRRPLSILVSTCVCALAVAAYSQARVLGQAAGAHRVATASTHPLNAPHLLSPGPGAHVQQIPALTWSSVAHAASYQFEVAVDPHFHSLVLASSGMTLSSTHNLAASLDQPQIDGTYYWRV